MDRRQALLSSATNNSQAQPLLSAANQMQQPSDAASAILSNAVTAPSVVASQNAQNSNTQISLRQRNIPANSSIIDDSQYQASQQHGAGNNNSSVPSTGIGLNSYQAQQRAAAQSTNNNVFAGGNHGDATNIANPIALNGKIAAHHHISPLQKQPEGTNLLLGQTTPKQKRPPGEETIVFFRGVTWMRDSHGLFDYESRNISKKNYKTKYTGKIIRQQNQIEFISPNHNIEDMPGYNKEEFKTMAQIRQDTQGFYVDHGDSNLDEESIDRLWLVIRSLKNPKGKYDYKINKFDTIKLGRIRFSVKNFQCEQMNLTSSELHEQELKEAQSVKCAKDFKDETEQPTCRFCWCPEEDDSNPLILACKCRGSVGLIHFQCLKNWIKTQRHTKVYGENVTSHYWKKFECEICKCSYPYIFKRNNQLFKLIDLEDPPKDARFILLESMPLDKNTSRNIHMLTVTDNKSEFKLGRGHESEVRINDISVSRCHAIIKCKKDGFYIEDNLSKFGTIVLLKDKMRLAEDHTMAVQVGRSVVSFTIKNIDVREKLRREIEPLLARNRKTTKDDQDNKLTDKDNQSLERSHGGQDLMDRLTNEQLLQSPEVTRNQQNQYNGTNGLMREPGKSMGPPASGAARMNLISNSNGNNANLNSNNLGLLVGQQSSGNHGRGGMGERMSSTDVNAAVQNSVMGATNMSGFGGGTSNNVPATTGNNNHTFANAGLSMMAGNNSTFGNAGAQAILGINSQMSRESGMRPRGGQNATATAQGGNNDANLPSAHLRRNHNNQQNVQSASRRDQL